MVYARIASGYRAGGPNLTLSPGIPAAFKPDQTKNYEIGAKVDLFHDRLSLDSSLYYIDWKDIQITETNPQTGLGYTGNGSEARSQGFELSVDSKPMPGLTLSAWITLADAEITQASRRPAMRMEFQAIVFHTVVAFPAISLCGGILQ